jgi:outer membrane lipoprotein-sorting protein
MRRISGRRWALPMAAAAAVSLLATPAMAQSTGPSGWAAAKTSPQGTVEIKLDPRQAQAVQRVSEYFNTLKQMRGLFVQIDPDKKRSRGRFYMQRPGKFRFDYSAPSKKIMASDGRFLRMREPDQASTDVVELDNTPFRMLLKPNVDLVRDARILDVQESDDLIVVALQDKSPDAPGRVQLVFTKKPGLDLKEWVVRDAQGLETKVEVGELNKTDPLDQALFRWEEQFFPNR